jgi:hypothetical protein
MGHEGVDRKIILKCVLKKKVDENQTVFISHDIGTTGELL